MMTFSDDIEMLNSFSIFISCQMLCKISRIDDCKNSLELFQELKKEAN